jgi:hypothetical protein
VKEQFEQRKTFRSGTTIQQIAYSGFVEGIAGRSPWGRAQLQGV